MKLTVMCLFIVVTVQAMKADEVSSFFLKAPKSVPRAGRSAPGAYDGFFLKASKSVPRVGRRNGIELYSPESEYPWVRSNLEKNQGPPIVLENEEVVPDYFYDFYPKESYVLDEGTTPPRNRRFEPEFMQYDKYLMSLNSDTKYQNN